MKLLLASLLVLAAAPTPELRYFRLQRPVNLSQNAPSQNAPAQACVALDAQTFSHTAPGLADLRLYRGTEETPYVIHNAQPRPIAQPTLTPVNRGVRKGKTVFDAAMPPGEHDEYDDLEINVDGHDFLATITVTGSQSVAGPATRIGGYTIFDFSRQKLGRSTVLHLPRSNFRSLHFEIAGPIAPDRIESISFSAAPPSAPKYLAIQSAGPLVRKETTSVAEFTLPPNVPIDRIVFTPPPQPVNFSRDVDVKVIEVATTSESAPPEPSTVASGNLLRIHRVEEGQRVDEEQFVLATPQTSFPRPTHWTIRIQNGDDAPVQFTSVQAQMLERNLCFEFKSGADYALDYGDKALAPPHYDYASWFAYQPNAAVASLGPEQANSAFQERPDGRPFTEKHPALLWIALVIVVLLLGVVASRTARPADQPAPKS